MDQKSFVDSRIAENEYDNKFDSELIFYLNFHL